MRKGWLARLVLSLGLTFAVGIPAVGWWQHTQAIVLHARMAENGGWTPENLTVAVGEPLHLQLTSDDVMHGFAVGQLNQPAVDVKPGEMTDVTLVFDKPGKYTFYCTRWCSVNHWRMRGTIEVTGDETKPESNKPPLYVLLGLDIDANQQASDIPAEKPSAWRGAMLNRVIPEPYKNHEYYLSHTPLDLWLALKSEPSLNDLDNQEVWDLVAWVWQSNASREQVQEGEQLFSANCAACHGESGEGNGVFADQLTENLTSVGSNQAMEKQAQSPANFTDVSRMLSTSPAHLQGKIIRGGMGTGMPYWGPIFTDDQTWALIAYLWTFQFQLEVAP
ncbi:MAG TPA: c-type cytochrome [Anaerolineales bacterium]